MKTRVKMLKVKIKSLAAEARIIRLEERRCGKDDVARCCLHEHRVGVVRNEQRLSLLAYAFIRGRSLSAIEPKSSTLPDWSRVAKMVEKFGVLDHLKMKEQAVAFKEWSSNSVASGK